MNKPNYIIDIDNQTDRIIDLALIEDVITFTLEKQTLSSANIAVCIVDEPAMQAINADYRGKDKPTNILSFPFDAPEGLPKDALEVPFLGDLVICPGVLETEARNQQKHLQDHWQHILIHGILHLLGYDHIEDEEAEIMEALEIKLLAQRNINNPYTERN